jgi:hypothetical protein
MAVRGPRKDYVIKTLLRREEHTVDRD